MDEVVARHELLHGEVGLIGEKAARMLLAEVEKRGAHPDLTLVDGMLQPHPHDVKERIAQKRIVQRMKERA